MKNNLIKIAFFAFITLVILPLGASGTRIAAADEVDEELSSTIKTDPEYRGKKPTEKPAEAPAATPAPAPAPKPSAQPTNGGDEKEWKTMHSESKSEKTTSKKSESIKIDLEKHRIFTPKISFGSNSSAPTASSQAVIKQLANMLKKNDLSIRIEGHTDSIGYDQPNLELSQKRADRVKEILVESGVDANRLMAVGMGDRYPITSSVTPQGQEKNRRVEFHIIESEAGQAMMPPAEEQAPPPPAPVFPVSPEPSPMPPAGAPAPMMAPPPPPAQMPPAASMMQEPPAPSAPAMAPAEAPTQMPATPSTTMQQPLNLQAPLMAHPQVPAQMMEAPPPPPAAPMVNTPPAPAPAAPSPMMPPPPANPTSP